MAATDQYILLQKKDEPVMSSGDWGIVVTSMPPLVATEAKDAESNNWPDEDGLDMYNAPSAFMKEFEAEIGLACRGTSQECQKSYSDMLRYMTTGSTEMKLYSTWVSCGKGGVYFRKCSVPEIGCNTENGETIFVWNWSVTLLVSKPRSIITPDNQDKITKLIES